MYNIEHPDITSMERTGYPTFMDENDSYIYCDQCGRAIERGESYYHVFSHDICCDCLGECEELNE